MRTSSRLFGRSIAAGLSFTLALFLLVGGAAAQTAQTGKVKKPYLPTLQDGAGFAVFGNITLMTDNRSQGFSSSSEEGSISGDLGFVYRNFYFGISASTIDFGKATHLTRGGLTEVANVDVTYYAGYIGNYRSFEYDFGVSYATFPEAYDPHGEFDYFELNAGIAREIHKNLKGGFRIYYSPEFSGETGQNWVFEGELERRFTPIRGITPILTGVLGYQAGDEDEGNFDYWFWSVGLGLEFNDNFSFDLRYHDTADVPFSCSGQCDEAFVASFTLSF